MSKVDAETFATPTVVVSFADGKLEYPVEKTFKGKKGHIYLKSPDVYFITAKDHKIGEYIPMKVPLVPSPPPSMPSSPMPPSIPPPSMPASPPDLVKRVPGD